MGLCGQCRVRLLAGAATPPNETEKNTFSELELARGDRLACCTEVEGNVRVHIPRESLLIGQRLQVEGDDGELQVDPLVRAFEVVVPPPALSDPRADLAHLLESVLAHAGADLENMRFELALRGLGRRDPAVARMLAEVDAQRMALFTEKFLRYTGDETKSTELAVLFYLAIVGSYQALSRPKNPPQIKELMQGIIARYLIEQQGPR